GPPATFHGCKGALAGLFKAPAHWLQLATQSEISLSIPGHQQYCRAADTMRSRPGCVSCRRVSVLRRNASGM
ncbi:hypothetical protein M513_12943, partial [Trichuris suis]